jgi:transmembrane sensor
MRAEGIDELASLWLAREQGGLTQEEQAAFQDWLDQSSRNTVAYLRLRAAWERAGRLAALRTPMRSAPPPKNPWAKLRIPAFAAIVLGLVYGANTYLAPGHRQELVYSTSVGQIRTYQLADGTRMDLNTGARVRADITGSERMVRLEAGEAFFDVTHDARHPFVVYAGKHRLTDLGTKFSVFLDGDDLRLLVLEGRVRMETQPGLAGPAPVMADAGHLVVAQGTKALVYAKPDSDVARALSWRNGMLIFDQSPLTEVAKEFNRYNARHIVVEGNARNMRIGGTFKADNVDAFALLLHQAFGFTVKSQGDKIVVSR